MAVEEQAPVATAAGISAMDVDTGTKPKYVLTFHKLHVAILVATRAPCYH